MPRRVVRAAARAYAWFHEGPVLTLRTFCAAFFVLFALVTIALAVAIDLVAQNRSRIVEIQAVQRATQESRIISCKTTYGSFVLMFRPLLPPGPERTWPRRAREDWEALKHRGVTLARTHCRRQTRVPPTTEQRASLRAG